MLLKKYDDASIRSSQRTKAPLATLPPELWLIVLDLVINEGIFGLDHGDSGKPSYINAAKSTPKPRQWFYGLYCELRLVCRSFNAILGPPPFSTVYAPDSPLQPITRAICMVLFEAKRTNVQQILADFPQCERVVYLEVTCQFLGNQLTALIGAAAEPAFPNVQHLILWISQSGSNQSEGSFWNNLNRCFPQLVTLVMQMNSGTLYLVEQACNPDVVLEKLEVLHFSGVIIYMGCRFPSLRHISVESFSLQSEFKTILHSPHLKSLFIRTNTTMIDIDVRVFYYLRVLGIPLHLLHQLAVHIPEHPLKHLWVFMSHSTWYSLSKTEVWHWIPGVLRVTFDMSTCDDYTRARRTKEIREVDFEQYGMAINPRKSEDSLIVVEPLDSILDETAVNEEM